MKLNKTIKISFLLLPGISGGNLVVDDVTQPAFRVPCPYRIFAMSQVDIAAAPQWWVGGRIVGGRLEIDYKDLVHRKFLR